MESCKVPLITCKYIFSNKIIIKALLNIAGGVIFAVMSVTIHLEDFQSWSEVFQEIDRQRRMRLFEIIQPNPSVTNDREKKRKAFVEVPAKRRFSERGMNNANPRKVYWRARLTSSPCATISEINSDIPDNLQRDSRFTEAAEKLSKEEMALLYEDIVKPLDVYSILTEKRREMRDHK